MKTITEVKPIESITVGDKTVEIHADTDSETPRTSFDNLGTFLYHCEMTIGDKYVSRKDIEETSNRKDILFLPVYAYEHSILSVNTTGFNCPWDSGQCGIIYVTHDDIVKCFGELTDDTKEIARQCLEGEVETLDQYFLGEVYGYIVLDENGFASDDSCWGFYGLDDARAEATNAITE